MTAISGFFTDTVLGPLRPPAQIQQWDRDANDPFGFRQWESGNYKPNAKIGLVGGFDAQLESGNVLNFGEVTTNDNGFLTDTVVFTFNFGEVNAHPDSFFDQMVAASSVGTNFKAFNMRLWRGSVSAFTSTGAPTPVFHFLQSSGWKRGFTVTPGGADTSIVPTAIPPSGNIFANQTGVFVSGVYQDVSFSNFIYMRGKFPAGAFTLGTYGGLGESTFTFNFSYDWTDINAAVLVSDLLPCLSPALGPDAPPGPPAESSLPSGMVSFWNLDENSPRIDKYGNTHVQPAVGVLSGAASGILSYWRLEESSGTRLDSVGSNDLTDINTVGFTPGVIGNSAVFVNANEEELQAANASVLDFDGTADFTFVCWAYVDDLDPPGSDQIILGKYDDDGGSNDRQYLLFFDASTDQFRALISEDGASNSADVSPANNILADTFIFLVMEYDASTRTLTLTQGNGTGGDTASAVAANAIINQSARVFTIGNSITTTGDAFLDGRVDEVIVYNRLLTSSEKTSLYNSGSGRNINNSVSGPIQASGVSSSTSFASQFSRDGGQYLTASGISIDSRLNFADEAFSMSAFVFLDSKPSVDTPIVARWKEPNDKQYKLSYDGASDRFEFSVSNDGSTSSDVEATSFGSPSLNTWYYVYGEHSGNQIGISVDNGALNTTAHTGGASASGVNDLEIGGADLSAGRSTFDGRIDALGIWNKLLSSDERDLLIVGGSGLQFPFGLQTSVASDINTFWRMNEGSGLSRFDVINGVELTNFGGATDRIGLIGSGTNFERGKSQYLQASGGSQLAFGDEDFTVAGWFNFNNIDPTNEITPMISKWQVAGDNLEYRLSFNSAINGFQFAVASGGSPNGIVTITASGIAQSGQWHLVIGEHDSVKNQIRIKVDKDIAQSGDFFGGAHAGVAPFQIAGLPASGTFFDGGADSIGTWNRKLTDEEFGILFNE